MQRCNAKERSDNTALAMVPKSARCKREEFSLEDWSELMVEKMGGFPGHDDRHPSSSGRVVASPEVSQESIGHSEDRESAPVGNVHNLGSSPPSP